MIEASYQRYLSLTGNPLAASNLVLAEAFAGQSEPARQDQPLSVKEAAKRLNVATRTVYDLCAAGRLKHHRVGVGKGALRILTVDLKAFQQGAEVEPPKTAALSWLDALR